MLGRVLVVDDDQFVLLSLMKMQKRLGYTIEPASSSRQALEMIRSTRPFDVVLTDRDMPGMDGLEFLRRAREQAPDMVRLMLSGSTRDALIEEAVRDGLLLRFISKPCMPHQLAIHLEAAMNEQRDRALSSQ